MRVTIDMLELTVEGLRYELQVREIRLQEREKEIARLELFAFSGRCDILNPSPDKSASRPADMSFMSSTVPMAAWDRTGVAQLSVISTGSLTRQS